MVQLEDGQALGRRTSVVEDDGVGRIPAGVAQLAGAEPEVDILVVDEERLVEAAELPQDVAAPERRASRGAEDLDLVLVLAAVVLPVAAWMREERPVEHVTSAVDRPRRIHEHHLRGGGGGVGMALEACGELLQPGGLGLGVVVEERHVDAACGLDSAVVGSGEAEVVPELDDPHFGVVLADELEGAVRRAVVGDDHFERAVRLRP